MFAKKYILFKRIPKKVVIFIKSKAFPIKRIGTLTSYINL
ncbi:hypothetical protein BACUNI_01687 [Bacteroides uniformis ATCC 8492]|uniref:Uncharacterized protein n=1 Tax=Bacteroides uniformis (strain ATCC 8492 / DSM 6597 / CCUG 4942 / CIP 103695 / JCM 5828 / KCTC 5204 / NCTC 13054 / VPI 0061) TaxID=411479 RepID=A0ABC9NDJ6_BACUC|nr:hypothetical protein BACUNI_01687 [Bacteroides uniformis ATCC 8492]